MTDSEKLAKLIEAAEELVRIANLYNHVDWNMPVRVELDNLRRLRDAYEDVTKAQ